MRDRELSKHVGSIIKIRIKLPQMRGTIKVDGFVIVEVVLEDGDPSGNVLIV